MPTFEKIDEERRLLQNPYAYLGGDGEYDTFGLREPILRADKTYNSKVIDPEITEERRLLENPYAYIEEDERYVSSDQILLDIDEIRSPEIIGKRVSDKEIEKIAKSLNIALWRNKYEIWGDEASNDPVAILDPAVAFRALGYEYQVTHSLGQFPTGTGAFSEVAGYINKLEMRAGISDQLMPPIQNFTAAHELGHAALHGAMEMHRDRPLEGGRVSGSRERVEVEADKFASYFLMPEKVVRLEFERRFLCKQFIISEDTAFALVSGSQNALRREYPSRRQLARKLAETSYYASRPITSLAERFNVSVEAMAIRLEELKLLQL